MTQEYVTKEQYLRDQRAGMNAVWKRPTDGIFYLGETTTKYGPTPTYEIPIFDTNVAKAVDAKVRAGNLDAKEAVFKPWIGEWQDIYNERIGVKSAAVVTNQVFSAIDTTTVANRLFGQEMRGFTIPDLVTTIPTDGLEYEIDTYTRFSISTGVPEGVAAVTKRGSVATTSYDLTKDVGHVAFTDEAILKSRQDLRGAHITNVQNDFKRAKSAVYADVLETATEINADDWDAFTSGLSDNNPRANIRNAISTIYSNNGEATLAFASDTAWEALTGNTFIRGAYNRNDTDLSANARVITADWLPNVSIGIDNELVSTSMIFMDREAAIAVQGPQRVGQYRDEKAGIDGYIARNWHQFQLVQTGKIRELATVTA